MKGGGLPTGRQQRHRESNLKGVKDAVSQWLNFYSPIIHEAKSGSLVILGFLFSELFDLTLFHFGW